MTPSSRAKARLKQARRVVIKIGSRALVDGEGRLERAVFRSVAENVARLRADRKVVALVSSGAILAGRTRLNLGKKNLTLPQKQAVAAVGQNDLMSEWARAFARHELKVGQILLTADDLADRTRYLNSRNTLDELLGMGVVPVINENDTVAVAEIRYGDNDHLATLIVGLIGADALIILTDIAGLCVEDPSENPAARVVHEVREADVELFACAGPSQSGVGSGGMASKIEAARTVGRRGVPTVIANGKEKNVVSRIMAGEPLGTLFVPEGPRMADRKYWMAFAGEPKGEIRIDEGAKKAVEERGKSLLPSGVLEACGDFNEGDMVRVLDPSGTEIARGLCRYSAADLDKIKGRKTQEIEAILGQKLYDEVIHRDDLVLTGQKRNGWPDRDGGDHRPPAAG